MRRDHEEDAKVFKALSSPCRLQVLEMLRGGERCACDLTDAAGLSPSTLSHHMKVLVDSGIVDARQDGKWVRYSISRQGADRAMGLLADLTRVTPDPTFRSSCC